MKVKHITIFYTVVVMMGVSALACNGFAASIEGTVQGINCVLYKKVCPTDNQDPLIAAENLFVVLDKADKYYFVSNLSNAVLSRYYAKKVRLTGQQHDKFNAIQADQLQVMVDGKWMKVWDLATEMSERRRLTIK